MIKNTNSGFSLRDEEGVDLLDSPFSLKILDNAPLVMLAGNRNGTLDLGSLRVVVVWTLVDEESDDINVALASSNPQRGPAGVIGGVDPGAGI